MKATIVDQSLLTFVYKTFSRKVTPMSNMRSISQTNHSFLEHFSITRDLLHSEPLTACSRDYGFDFDEDELASELLASLAATSLDHPSITIPADEFDTLYRWFS